MNTKNGKKYGIRCLCLLLVGILVFLALKPGYRIYRSICNYRSLQSKLPDLAPFHAEKKVRQRSFPEKIWIHRVNSIERAIVLAKQHKGLEIDVVYDSTQHYFDVGHPPVQSIGLSLSKLFAAIPDIKSHYFWLDYKNLSPANKLASCSLLIGIAKQYQLNNNIIVESSDPEDLDVFADAGFYTSYYIPSFDLAKCTSAEMKEYHDTILFHLSRSTVNALSSQSRSLPFIEKYFPEQDILLWHLDDRKGLEFYSTIVYLKMKSKVKVVLVNQDNTVGYR